MRENFAPVHNHTRLKLVRWIRVQIELSAFQLNLSVAKGDHQALFDSGSLCACGQLMSEPEEERGALTVQRAEVVGEALVVRAGIRSRSANSGSPRNVCSNDVVALRILGSKRCAGASAIDSVREDGAARGENKRESALGCYLLAQYKIEAVAELDGSVVAG